MATIKEKAKEVFPEHCNFYTNSCNERKRIGFEAGAKYVLEEIENIVTNNEDNTFCMARCLVDKIEELKGK